MLCQDAPARLILDTRSFSTSNADQLHDAPTTPVFGGDSILGARKVGSDPTIRSPHAKSVPPYRFILPARAGKRVNLR